MKTIQKLLVLTLLFNVPAYGAQIQKDAQAKPATQNNAEMITPDQMDDQKKAIIQQTFYNLQEPATHSIEFQENEKEYIEILRALIELEEERQELDSGKTKGDALTTIAYLVNSVKKTFQANSKSGSFGFFAPFCNWPRWYQHGFHSIDNNFSYEITNSKENDGLATVNIHAKQITDRIAHDKEPQPKHRALAVILRKIDDRSTWSYYFKSFYKSDLPKHHKLSTPSTDSVNIKGIIKGKPLRTWGGSQNISIECRPEILAYLVKDRVRQKLNKQKQEEEALLD